MRIPGAIAAMTIGATLAFAHAAPATADPAALEAGKQVFLEIAEPNCGICHTLADAGAAGQVGPDLDSLQADVERVKTAVVNGIGAMPAYESLTPEQIGAVALYVATVTGGVK